MTLRCITVRQPHCALIAIGQKPVENRGANTTLRGEIAIHAAKAFDLAEVHECQLSFPTAPFTVLGAVLAIADLVGCHLADQDSGTTCCQPYGRRMHGDRPAHHLILANVRRLDRPVECRGQLGVGWRLPVDVEATVRAQLSPTA